MYLVKLQKLHTTFEKNNIWQETIIFIYVEKKNYQCCAISFAQNLV